MSDQRAMDRAAITHELLTSAVVDWVSAHDLVWVSTHGDRSATAKQRAIDVLRHLFESGLMVPGDLGEAGFEDWAGSPDDWTQRATADLERLGWSPMGDGFWLRLASD